MTYPTSNPTMKHDLQCTKQIPSDRNSLLDEIGFSSSSDLFRSVAAGYSSPPSTLCSVYSYADAPDFPGPLSRSLIVCGVAGLSISLVRTLVTDDEIPDCLHKCTVAVQLADEKHYSQLEARHQKNSTIFAKLMKRLRRESLVAVISKDKHGRFGFLIPMKADNAEHGYNSHNISIEDCSAFCFTGTIDGVMEYLGGRGATAAEAASSEIPTNSLWLPPGQEIAPESESLWKPPVTEEDDNANGFSIPWQTNQSDGLAPWETSNTEKLEGIENMSSGGKRNHDEMSEDAASQNTNFHTDTGAAAADAFYSGLTRKLDTRADSHLYHMRSFNGWVKATQISELDPRIVINGKPTPRGPLRVLDLACGKGGDLTKWSLHERGIGVDVARGSLKDAAVRIREMRKRNKLAETSATLICADLGADVPGRKKSPSHKNMQRLLAWSLKDETENETAPPEFKMFRGGGVSEKQRFDVVSIQFAIHYMMSTGKRARRFFHTVSELLDIGGNLICTTIDARVVVGHLMGLGLDYHFDCGSENGHFDKAVVEAGAGACKITIEPEIVKRILKSKATGSKCEEDLFGLQYTFTLVEGSDHKAGVGDAVNLPEWLTPIPILESLGKEAGLELEYAENFHEFYENRNTDPSARNALYNMKVLNRNGSLSKEEWSISRLYAAIRFRKVRESSIHLDEDVEDHQQDESDDEEDQRATVRLDPIKAKKMLPVAMIKAKKATGEAEWRNLSSDEKTRRTQIELEKIASM
eukprot:scaffold2243_cov122-Cylindrotheca_fusiformis.AAC.25